MNAYSGHQCGAAALITCPTRIGNNLFEVIHVRLHKPLRLQDRRQGAALYRDLLKLAANGAKTSRQALAKATDAKEQLTPWFKARLLTSGD